MAACLLAAFLVHGAQAQPAANSKIPRTADGKPDLAGVWQGGSNRIGSWEEANANGGQGAGGMAAANGPVRVTPFKVPASDTPPYKPELVAKVREAFDRRGIDEPMARCYPPGVPRTTVLGLFPMQIVQTQQMVVMLFEVFGVWRIIPLNGKHPDDLDPSFSGDSAGHWEGDTLVVDVTGFNDKTWLTGVGTFHSEKLHVVERFTRADENTIVYSATIDDPEVFTKPWTIHNTIMLRPGMRLREYVCSENNIDVSRFEELLKTDLFRRSTK
jgi:hypothetical protein